MAWVRLDDGFMTNPKIVGLTDAEFRVWIRVLCHCAEAKDPTVDDHTRYEVRGLDKKRLELFAGRGLLDVVAGHSPERSSNSSRARSRTKTYVVHDWLRYQPKDATNAERQAKWRAKQGVTNPVTETVTEPVTETVTPSRAGAFVPVPVPESKAFSEEESSQRQKRTEIRGNGLPVEKERLVLNLIAAIRKPLEQEEADSLRKYASALPESALVKAIESVKRKNAADPLKYAFGVLLSEKRELAARSAANV